MPLPDTAANPPRPDHHAAGRWPLRVADLTFGEQFLVWAMRQWITGAENRALIAVEARRLFRGEARSDAAMAAFDALLEGLGRRARRVLYLHSLASRWVSADEATLLVLIGCLQHGRHEHADALLRWLTPPDTAAVVAAAGARLGRALAKAGRPLPVRMAPPPAAARIEPCPSSGVAARSAPRAR